MAKKQDVNKLTQARDLESLASGYNRVAQEADKLNTKQLALNILLQDSTSSLRESAKYLKEINAGDDTRSRVNTIINAQSKLSNTLAENQVKSLQSQAVEAIKNSEEAKKLVANYNSLKAVSGDVALVISAIKGIKEDSGALDEATNKQAAKLLELENKTLKLEQEQHVATKKYLEYNEQISKQLKISAELTEKITKAANEGDASAVKILEHKKRVSQHELNTAKFLLASHIKYNDSLSDEIQLHLDLQLAAKEKLESLRQEKEAVQEILKMSEGPGGIQDQVIAAAVANANTAAVEKRKKLLEETKSKVLGEVEGAEELLHIFKNIVSNPLTAMVGLLVMAWEELSALEKVQREFLNTAGLTVDESKELLHTIHVTAVEYEHLGVTMEMASKAASALVNTFVDVHSVTDDMVKNVALMGARFGVAAEDASQVMFTMHSALGATKETATTVSVLGANLAKAGGVSAAKVFKDMASSSKEIAIYFKGSATQLAKSAVEAARLGMSLKDMANVTKALLDFENSVNDQMEASVLLGREINMDKARSLALDGDIEGATKEVLNQVGSLAEFNKLNAIQKEKIAKAAGMEVDQLQKSLQKSDDILHLSKEERAEYEKAASELKNINQHKADSVLTDAKNQLAQEKFNNAMHQLMVTLTDSILPAVQAIATGLATIVRWATILLKPITEFVKLLTHPLEDINYITAGVGTLTVAVLVLKSATTGWIGSMLGGLKSMGKQLLALPGMLKEKGLFGGAKTFFSKKPSGMLGPEVPKDYKPPTTPGPADQTKKLSSTSKLNAGNMIKAAGAILILSAAMWVAAKAFQEFAKVDWKNAWPGILVLGGLVATANLLAKGSTNMIKGSIAVAILGAALLPFTYAMSLVAKLDMKAVLAAAAGLVIFGAAVFGLGLLINNPIGAALFTVGIIGIIALGGALVILGKGLQVVSNAGAGIASLFKSLSELDAKKLDAVAPALETIGKAILFLGAGGVLSAIGKLLGGDSPVKIVKDLVTASTDLDKTSVALRSIGTSMGVITDNFTKMSQAIKEGLDPLLHLGPILNDISKNLSSVATAGVFALPIIGALRNMGMSLETVNLSTTTSKDKTSKELPTSAIAKETKAKDRTDEVLAKLDKLIDVISRNVDVKLDGKKVGEVIALATPRHYQVS